MTSENKWNDLRTKMEKLGIFEHDIVEKFILGSGRGGQNLQKTSSCVYLKHEPTGMEVKCQKAGLRNKIDFLLGESYLKK